jgi:hypothetical protein
MIDRKTWDEFRETGLTLIINQILHIFGWAIVYDVEDDKVVNCYPARTKFRGFEGGSISKAYIKVSQWMKNNAEELLKEAEGEEE